MNQGIVKKRAAVDGEEGVLPMQVVLRVLSIWSGGMESVGVDWTSWIVSGESA